MRLLNLCPGFTRTEFHERGGMDVSWRAVTGSGWTPTGVVADALADLDAGRSRSVPGAAYKVAVVASRLVPGGLQRRVVARIRDRMPQRA